MIILITFEVRSLLRGSVGGQDLERSVIARVLDDVCIQSRSNRNVSFSIANGNVKIRKGGGYEYSFRLCTKMAHAKLQMIWLKKQSKCLKMFNTYHSFSGQHVR